MESGQAARQQRGASTRVRQLVLAIGLATLAGVAAG